MVFYEVEPLASSTDYVKEAGKYQSSQDIEEVKKMWHPEQMIPRMHLDWETKV